MASSSDPPTWSLTSHLLSFDRHAYEAATRAPFLTAAGQGRVGKTPLGKWLANDRLYTHAYVQAAGRTLASVPLPQTTTGTPAETSASQLVDWICDTLVALRREDRLFVDVAERYGLPIDLEVEEMTTGDAAGPGGPREEGRRMMVREAAKIPGLVMFERLFGSLSPLLSPAKNTTEEHASPLPWLEAAVVFWGTERVYLDAWTWAKTCQRARAAEGAGGEKGPEEDADGGALRKEFIPNWSSEEFGAFVDKLAGVIDGAVAGLVEAHGEVVKAGLAGRAEKVWRELVAAEGAFWPHIE